jgi:GDPmannose 4,6-dehydratase
VDDAPAGEADDYVIATGKTITVREFAELAFQHVGLDFKDTSRSTRGTCARRRWTCCWAIRARPSSKLGWKPETSVEQLAAMMVDHDSSWRKREKTLRDAGHPGMG